MFAVFLVCFWVLFMLSKSLHQALKRPILQEQTFEEENLNEHDWDGNYSFIRIFLKFFTFYECNKMEGQIDVCCWMSKLQETVWANTTEHNSFGLKRTKDVYYNITKTNIAQVINYNRNIPCQEWLNKWRYKQKLIKEVGIVQTPEHPTPMLKSFFDRKSNR